MASRIEALSGPNKGWAYRFRATEVHIGRAAGCHIRLDDPAWQQGHLRLQHVQAGWLVTNNLPHPIYLDGEVLPERGQRTWYHGTKLQPTASTVLILFADDSGEGLPQKGNAVVAVPSARAPLVATDLYQVFETSDLPAGSVNIVTGKTAELAGVLAKHDDVDGLWIVAESATCAATEKESIGNLKRVWTSNGLSVDWQSEAGSTHAFLRRAVEVKNVWVPYGD